MQTQVVLKKAFILLSGNMKGGKIQKYEPQQSKNEPLSSRRAARESKILLLCIFLLSFLIQ